MDSDSFERSKQVASNSLSLNRRRFLGITSSAGLTTLFVSSGISQAATQLRGRISEFEADSASGFNYPYFIYVPEIEGSHPRPILIDPTNNPSATDDFAKVREYGRQIVEGGISRRMSDELGVPLLVPLFPRPRSEPVDWRHEIQMLDQETMHISDGPLERVDRQLVSMIEHATEQLQDDSIKTTGTVLLNGFSASGNFINRFTALHPHLVDSVSAGGINGTPILPIEEAKGRSLNYPIGIADFESVTGSTFQRETWQTVDQLLYMGGEDQNDTIPYADVWNDTQREVALDVYGEHMQEDRMPYSARIYEAAGANARFEVYPNVGHGYKAKMRDALVDFHRPHAGTWAALFESRPSIGDEAVHVAGGVPGDANATGYRLRIYSDTQESRLIRSETLTAGETLKTSVSLHRPVESEETLTVALIPDGGTKDQALASDTTKAVGSLEFIETPVGGDSEVTVGYELASAYDSSRSTDVRIETESGGSVVLQTIDPGSSGTIGAELETDNGIPFMSQREVSLVIVENDPAGAKPIAQRTMTVETPDTPAAELNITAEDVIEQGDIVPVETEVRGLGGETQSALLQISVNGSQVAQESIAISRGTRTTFETSVRTDEYEHGQITIEAQYNGRTVQTSVILAKQPESGVGTESNPFILSSPEELAYTYFRREGAYELQDSLDLSEYETFPIIGSMNEPFSGTVNGNFNTISNLRITGDRDKYEGVGLFGNIESAEITQLRLHNVNVEGGVFTGALVGNAKQEGTLSKIVIDGRVSGESNVGGLIGGTTTGDADSSNISISQIGMNAEVRGTSKVGGIVGQASGETIQDTYVSGPVISDRSGGGIFGWAVFGTTLTTSYNAGLMGVSDPIAGGTQEVSIASVYFDKQATGHSNSQISSGTGLETAEMTGDAAPDNLDEFDFESTWEVGTDDQAYPRFQWEANIETIPESEESGQTQTPVPTTSPSTTTDNSDQTRTAEAATTTADTPQTQSKPTLTATQKPPTETDSKSKTSASDAPGLGIVHAISAIGGLVYVLKRRLS